jgi:hypothetical protein
MAPIAGDTSDTAPGSTSGNPLMEADPIDVVMAVNADNDPLTGLPPDDQGTSPILPTPRGSSPSLEPSALP